MSQKEMLKTLLEEMVPFVGKVGIQLIEAGPHRVKLSLPKDASNFNHVGSYHAGALFTFAETCAAAVVAVSIDLGKYRLLVKEGSIRYKRAVYNDITCEVSLPPEELEPQLAQIDEDGRGILPVTVHFIDGEGMECAEATMNFHLKCLS